MIAPTFATKAESRTCLTAIADALINAMHFLNKIKMTAHAHAPMSVPKLKLKTKKAVNVPVLMLALRVKFRILNHAVVPVSQSAQLVKLKPITVDASVRLNAMITKCKMTTAPAVATKNAQTI